MEWGGCFLCYFLYNNHDYGYNYCAVSFPLDMPNSWFRQLLNDQQSSNISWVQTGHTWRNCLLYYSIGSIKMVFKVYASYITLLDEAVFTVQLIKIITYEIFCWNISWYTVKMRVKGHIGLTKMFSSSPTPQCLCTQCVFWDSWFGINV